ncbi:MAG TPA: transcriptional regulator [Microscillaceae bacterium]|jgi:DNA-binding HxlR family transcriptional regulator|nr:transcriptional regulator [Microscillaceae bacterium]
MLKGAQQECPKRLKAIRDALEVINGKWKIPIITTLMFGKRRFKELLREIDGITPKMLSKELKELEMSHLVKRTVFDTSPVTVEYAITPFGMTLGNILEALHDWGAALRNHVIFQDRMQTTNQEANRLANSPLKT